MKKVYFLYVLTLLVLIVPDIYGQKRKPTANEMLFNSAQGREFWIAIPANEVPDYSTQAIDIYITSSKNTDVRITNPYTGLNLNKHVDSMQVTTVSTVTGDIGWDLECRESETITNQALHFESDQPISIYVLNTKPMTSDGYLAIPTNACGLEYIHCCYWDFGEIEKWGSGFIVIPTEDQTEVTIQLRGQGKGAAKTLMGRDIGDIIKVTLNAGQTYMVRGDGVSRGLFDLSGSRILANKPIGVISFHMRTMIPNFDIWNGRNHLAEMIPPVSAWGKRYITCEFKRASGQGDFFRIIGSQANTTFRCTYYDKDNGKVLGHFNGQLRNAGDFQEYLQMDVRAGNKEAGIHGVSVFEADKPVLVMQYSYSSDWDGDPIFDPFMVLVVPQEQFIPQTVFQSPSNKVFLSNYFNIIAVDDTTDPTHADLKSIKIDGKPITSCDGGTQFLMNTIPTTNCVWAKVTVTPGPHKVTSNGKARFGGYIYGFSSYDAYAWPAAMAINKIDEVDTLPPVLTIAGECGDFTINVTEKRNGKTNDDPRQVDQGVENIELMDESYNFDLIMPPNFKPYPPVYETQFQVVVTDKKKNGFAKFVVTDRYGNITIDSVAYAADFISLNPNEINFGNVRLRTTKNLTAILTNEGDSVVTIKSIKLLKSEMFKITKGAVPPEIQLNPKETFEIDIAYTPITESISPDILDKDSLQIITKCDTTAYYVKGRGVIPKIMVDDWNAGVIKVNTSICMDVQTGNGLRIQNPGTDTLIITGINGVVPPFSLSNGFQPSLPIIIAPKDLVYLTTPCFAPPQTISYSIDVTFNNNAEGPDSVSTWQGLANIPGPYITPYDFGHLRLNTFKNNGKCYIRNSGSSSVKITGINLQDGTKGFNIIMSGVTPQPSKSSPVDLQPVGTPNGDTLIEVPVTFLAGAEGFVSDSIRPEFDDSEKIPAGSVSAELRAYGYIPKIEVTGYEFLPAILMNTLHPKTGYVTIKSTSKTADLFVESIKWNQQAQADFQWLSIPPSNVIIPMGDSLRIPVSFKPTKIGTMDELVDIVNDAYPTPDSIRTNSTDVKGYALSKGITVTDIDYGVVLLCNQPVKEDTIINTGSIPALIYNIALESGDVSAFQIIPAFPDTIASGSSKTYKVIFKPNKIGNFLAYARVYANTDSVHIIKLVGKVYNVPVVFSLRKYTASDRLLPGVPITMDVSLNNPKPDDALITNIKMEIIYNTNWMIYNNVIDKGPGLDKTWAINATEVPIDNTTTKLVITGQGTNHITQQNGVIFIPRFLVMLSSDSTYNPKIGDISLGLRDSCVTTSSNPGQVVFNSCVVELRNVIFSSTKYALHDVSPNPITGSSFDLKYDVGLQGQTRVEIVNSTGQLVRLICDDEKEVGKYTESIPTSELNSGVYFIKMNSGPFSDSKRLIISK